MSQGTRVAVGASVSMVLLVLLVAWATWTYTLSSMDRTMVLDLLGFASVGGQ